MFGIGSDRIELSRHCSIGIGSLSLLSLCLPISSHFYRCMHLKIVPETSKQLTFAHIVGPLLWPIYQLNKSKT